MFTFSRWKKGRLVFFFQAPDLGYKLTTTYIFNKKLLLEVVQGPWKSWVNLILFAYLFMENFIIRIKIGE